eukprot:719535-Alexandrium_andersonii.AAC.1
MALLCPTRLQWVRCWLGAQAAPLKLGNVSVAFQSHPVPRLLQRLCATITHAGGEAFAKGHADPAKLRLLSSATCACSRY